jgi:ankyrin repeat protein
LFPHIDNSRTVELLLQNGADIESRNEYGATALYQAAEFGNTEIEAKDKEGQTALMAAAGWGRVENMQLLLDNNARIEARATQRCSSRRKAVAIPLSM